MIAPASARAARDQRRAAAPRGGRQTAGATGRDGVRTTVAGRLEQADFVLRAPTAADDRGVAIALTPAGRAAGERIIAYINVAYSTMFADWPAQERADLERLVVKMVRSPDAVSGQAVSAVAGPWADAPRGRPNSTDSA